MSPGVSALLAEKADCLTTAPIPYGDTFELEFWPGTIHVDSPVLDRISKPSPVFFKTGLLQHRVSLLPLPQHENVDLLVPRLHGKDGAFAR
jgi:hypothetical protein